MSMKVSLQSTQFSRFKRDREGGETSINSHITLSNPTGMAAMNLDGPSLLPDFGPAYESDIEAELEVDQLDSDSDNDDALDPTNANNISKNGTGRAGERVPGHTLLSAVRIGNMIQADGLCIIPSSRSSLN